MKRDHKEDSIYMQHKIEEILNDLAFATDTITLEVKNIEMEQVEPLIKIENKIIKLLQDIRKGV